MHVIALAPAVAKLYIEIMLALATFNVREDEEISSWNICIRKFFILVFLLVPGIVFTIATILPLIGPIRDTFFRSSHSYLQYYSYLGTIILTIYLSGKLVVRILNAQAYEGREKLVNPTSREPSRYGT